MTKKTTRKNNTNQTVNYPSHDEYFTIKSMLELNPNMVPITLRVRLQNAVSKEKTVSIIGSKNSGKGRPTLAFSMCPVSNIAIQKAMKDGITLKTPFTVPVVQINSESIVQKSETPSVVINETSTVTV